MLPSVKHPSDQRVEYGNETQQIGAGSARIRKIHESNTNGQG